MSLSYTSYPHLPSLHTQGTHIYLSFVVFYCFFAACLSVWDLIFTALRGQLLQAHPCFCLLLHSCCVFFLCFHLKLSVQINNLQSLSKLPKVTPTRCCNPTGSLEFMYYHVAEMKKKTEPEVRQARRT